MLLIHSPLVNEYLMFYICVTVNSHDEFNIAIQIPFKLHIGTFSESQRLRRGSPINIASSIPQISLPKYLWYGDATMAPSIINLARSDNNKKDGQHYIIASTLTTQIDHSNGYCTTDGAVRW